MGAAQGRVLVLDVDGVLTDGSIWLDDNGREWKRFHVHDGMGLGLWRKAGGRSAILSGRASLAVRHRADELRVDAVVMGCEEKAEGLQRVLDRLGATAAAIAYLGDDLPDIPPMRACGYPMAVSDACAEVRAVARFVCARPGGSGAVREAVEHLLGEACPWGRA